jgi:hypothetical protein
VRLDEDQWEDLDDNTWQLSIKHLHEIDRFQVLGPGNVPMHLDLETTYRRKPGRPILITPQTNDPMSPNNWAGIVWEGSATSRFSATSDDGSWSVQGWADYAHSGEGTTGHIMHERNGVFVHQAK